MNVFDFLVWVLGGFWRWLGCLFLVGAASQVAIVRVNLRRKP